MKTPFLGTAYVSRSRDLSLEQCINLYPEIVETKQGAQVGAFYAHRVWTFSQRWAMAPFAAC